MLWLRRWNFIERARLERRLWEAFERGENLEELVAGCERQASGGDAAAAWQLEVWRTTLGRIRRLEAMMRDRQPPAA